MTDRNRLPNQPHGVYRNRMCKECMMALEEAGYLTNPEKDSTDKAVCESCLRLRPVTRMYRYTLSSKARVQHRLNLGGAFDDVPKPKVDRVS